MWLALPRRYLSTCFSKPTTYLRSQFQPTPHQTLRTLTFTSTAMAAAPAPSAPSLVQHAGKEYLAIKEGRAHILNPPTQDAASKATRRDLKPEDESQSVFYNPIQQFNRDLSVLAIKAFGENVIASKREKFERRKGGKGKGKKRKREASQEGGEKVMENGNEAVSAPEQTDPKTAYSFTILDALSATGLRALRYASEIPFTSRVVANDLSPSAIETMKTNIEYNGLEKLIQQNIGDARAYMYSLSALSNPAQPTHTGKFDVIDLDPYGTAAPFMDAAVQAAKDGGLLCVTCTDAGVWASNGYPEKAFALYGGVPIKGSHSHEGGLRLILHGLATSAAKYGLAIEPLLSLSIDFYARVFVRIHKSPAEVKFVSGNTMMVYNCDSGCGSWSTQPLTSTRQRLDKRGNPFYHYGFAKGPVSGPYCDQCGFKTHLGGPMWAGPLHNPHFIQKILHMLPNLDREIYQTVDRIEGMLTTALEEDLDQTEPSTTQTTTEEPTNTAIIPRTNPALIDPHPFYFSLSALSKTLHTSTMPIDAFRGALRHLGYRSTRSHAKPNTIRTDASWDVVWEIMREWVRQKSPLKEGALKVGSAGAVIMSKGREALKAAQDEDQGLAKLKKEIVAAVESGQDTTDLITKIEAALYRSSSKSSEPTTTEPQPQPTEPSTNPEASQTHTKPSPHTLEIIFDESLGREASAAHTKKRLVRYQINPRANWGPLNRARIGNNGGKKEKGEEGKEEEK